MEKEFFPKVAIVGKKLVFNSEAIETMELDVKDSKVVIIETTNVEKKREPVEILIIKTNGSSCDDVENIKDITTPDRFRLVTLKEKDGEIISGSITVEQGIIDELAKVFGNKDEFKLLACNTDSPLGKEFKEQFEITNNYYRLVNIDDKRTSIGKEKNVKETIEERIKIN
jgi:hypothetical protein